jgi:hypothetical protein
MHCWSSIIILLVFLLLSVIVNCALQPCSRDYSNFEVKIQPMESWNITCTAFDIHSRLELQLKLQTVDANSFVNTFLLDENDYKLYLTSGVEPDHPYMEHSFKGVISERKSFTLKKSNRLHFIVNNRNDNRNVVTVKIWFVLREKSPVLAALATILPISISVCVCCSIITCAIVAFIVYRRRKSANKNRITVNYENLIDNDSIIEDSSISL